MKIALIKVYLKSLDKTLITWVSVGLIALSLATYIHIPSSKRNYHSGKIDSVVLNHNYDSIADSALVILDSGKRIYAQNRTNKPLKAGEIVTVTETHKLNTDGSIFIIE